MTPVAYDIIRSNEPLYEFGEPANWHRYQMSGSATEAGIDGALLAADGWVASRHLRHRWHLLAVVRRTGLRLELHVRRSREAVVIEQTSMKRWPVCRLGHAAHDLFDAIITEQSLDPSEIDDILVRISPSVTIRSLSENTMIDDPLKLVMSLPTAFGLIAHRVPAGPRWWEEVTSDRVRDVARKVRCEVNDEWQQIMADQVVSEGMFRTRPDGGRGTGTLHDVSQAGRLRCAVIPGKASR